MESISDLNAVQLINLLNAFALKVLQFEDICVVQKNGIQINMCICIHTAHKELLFTY
jgi:hypothetical protein